MDRIAAIQKMLAARGDDVFLHYSLGMEYVSAGRFDEAVESFRRCQQIDPGYLAAYVESGKALRSAGRLAEARQEFLRAMEVASAAGDKHVRDYVQQQLAGLPTE